MCIYKHADVLFDIYTHTYIHAYKHTYLAHYLDMPVFVVVHLVMLKAKGSLAQAHTLIYVHGSFLSMCACAYVCMYEYEYVGTCLSPSL